MYVAAAIVIVDIIMLFVAAFIGLPSYSYYGHLRFLTFLSAMAGVFTAHELPLNKIIYYAFIVLAVLFNPLFPVRLSRSVWINIDIVAGLLLTYMVYSVVNDYMRYKGETHENHHHLPPKR